jgi:hypothetical protein
VSGAGPALPLVLVAEDGDEYTVRFSRLLGGSFRFLRAGCFGELERLLAQAGPALLLFDLDFRRTPAPLLVDEHGAPATPAEAQRLASHQGILLLRLLRRRGVRLPALLCADLDDAELEERLRAELQPLQLSPSSEGLPEVAARLRNLLGTT